MVYRFRVRRVRWRLGISLLLLFAFISIGGGISLYGENATSWPAAARLLRGLGAGDSMRRWPFWAAWMLLFYYRGRILIGSRSIAVRGVLRPRRAVSKISRLRSGASGTATRFALLDGPPSPDGPRRRNRDEPVAALRPSAPRAVAPLERQRMPGDRRGVGTHESLVPTNGPSAAQRAGAGSARGTVLHLSCGC